MDLPVAAPLTHVLHLVLSQNSRRGHVGWTPGRVEPPKDAEHDANQQPVAEVPAGHL